MEKLYHLAKRFKAYQFDGDLKNSDGYYCPEWVQQAFERDELFFIGPELYAENTISPTRRKTLSIFAKTARR